MAGNNLNSEIFSEPSVFILFYLKKELLSPSSGTLGVIYLRFPNKDLIGLWHYVWYFLSGDKGSPPGPKIS